MKNERRWNEGELGWGYHIEPVPQIRDRRREELFDLECLHLNTGVKAIWILYRRWKWDLLASIGLPRDLYEARFIAFDDRFITSDHGLLRLDDQAERFADAVPGVRVAASTLIKRYEALYPQEVGSYYTKIARKIFEQLDQERNEEDATLPLNQH